MILAWASPFNHIIAVKHDALICVEETCIEYIIILIDMI